MRKIFLILILILSSIQLRATHITGGYIAYKLIDSVGEYYNYDITLTLYYDYYNGFQAALDNDYYAKVAVYDMPNNALVNISELRLVNKDIIYPFNLGLCNVKEEMLPLMIARFNNSISLKKNSGGYFISYQRCCNADFFTNISGTVTQGISLYTSISSNPTFGRSIIDKLIQSVFYVNKSNELNLAIPNTADDSITYELVPFYLGASQSNTAPNVPAPMPYDSASYNVGYSSAFPFGDVTFNFNKETGIMLVTPDRLGNYFINVKYIHWRLGQRVDSFNHTFNITVIDSQIRNVNKSYDTMTYVGNMVYLNANGGSLYNWVPSTYLDKDTGALVKAIFPNPGSYTYTVNISEGLCSRVDTFNVTVFERGKLFFPNAFTPNRDDVNDIFKPIQVGNNEIVSFKVYNKLGNLVYDGKNGWDGIFKGELQPQGVNTWVCVYISTDGLEIMDKGNVTLLDRDFVK